jgi:hypothetical protein
MASLGGHITQPELHFYIVQCSLWHILHLVACGAPSKADWCCNQCSAAPRGAPVQYPENCTANMLRQEFLINGA